MDVDDGLTDGKAQPDAGDRRLFVAAGEFIKDSLFLTRRDPRTIIPYLQRQLPGVRLGANADARPGAGILMGIFQQVDQHPLEQRPVDMHQLEGIG